MNMRGWTEDDRAEFEAACGKAWASSVSQRERTDEFLSLVRDGQQAQRGWAVEVLADAEHRGVGAILKGWRKAAAQVAVSFDGRVINKPRVIGARRQDDAGRAYDEQTLFDLMTWDELRVKRIDYLTSIKAYSENVGLVDRLLALHDVAPEATNPRDAAKALGTSVEDWLGIEQAS